MPLISLAFVFGGFVALYSSGDTDLLWIAYFPFLILIAYLVPGYRLVAMFFIGFLWATLQIQSIDENRRDFQTVHDSIIIEGIVSDIPTRFDKNLRFYFKPYASEPGANQYPDLLRLSWYRTSQVMEAGQHWRLLVKLKPPHGFQNPGGFDYEKWLYSQGVAATGYVRTSSINQLLNEPSSFNLNHIRSQLIDQLPYSCEACEYISLIKALLTGYRGEISDQQQQILQRTGTAHLLAISGLHIGLVATFVYFLAGLAWKVIFFRTGLNRFEFSAVFSLSAACIYAALAGFSLPTIRALIMLSVVLLSIVLRKRGNLLNSLCVAVIVIVAMDIRSLLSSSFWMSISAVFIIAFAFFRLKREKNRMKQFVYLQFYFSLLLAPLGLLIFNQVSLSGFLANLVAIPLLSLAILPVLMIGVMLLPLSEVVASFALQFANILIRWLFTYLGRLDSWTLSFDGYISLPTPVIIVSLVGILVMLMPFSMSKKAGALMLIILPFVWRADQIPHGSYEAQILDVGMGTSVVIQTAGHSLIYDFGPGSNTGFNAGNWVIKPYLRSKSIAEPDLMIISHIDQDHSGGFHAFSGSSNAQNLLSGTKEETISRFNLEHSVKSCHHTKPWQWDGVHFEFLTTGDFSPGSSTNNRSCVLRISGFHQFLLAGDIETEQEYKLTKSFGDSLKSDILLAPHHGSLTSSSEIFINATSAEHIIFTSGFNNRWGFPKSAVVERYHQIGSQTYRTDLDGAISLKSSNKGLFIVKRRSALNRRWHSKY